MKFIFSLLIIMSMAKECNKNTASKSLDSTDSTEQSSNKNIFDVDTITVKTQTPSGKYFITFLKEADIDSVDLTINFDENSNKVSGHSGCNSFSGTYIIKGTSITFGRFMVTKMYCEKTQEAENLFLRNLSNSNSFLIKENELILKNNEEDLITAQKETIVNIEETIQLQENTKIEYKAISRGTYYDAIITRETISVQKDRNSKTVSKTCNKDSWSNLMNVLNGVDLKNISILKAPTEARFYDGAATAQLIITQDNSTFESNSFDHGTPPKEIEALVKEILSMAENVE